MTERLAAATHLIWEDGWQPPPERQAEVQAAVFADLGRDLLRHAAPPKCRLHHLVLEDAETVYVLGVPGRSAYRCCYLPMARWDEAEIAAAERRTVRSCLSHERDWRVR